MYVQIRQTPVIGTLVRIFDKLRNLVNKIAGTHSAYLNNLFYRINSGKFADTAMVYTENEIRSYHQYKMSHDNLSEEDKQYIKDRGLSTEEYENMSLYEKEVLFHCKW